MNSSLRNTAMLLAAMTAGFLVPAHAQTGLTTAPWPMFHHDVQHTGVSPYTGPATAAQKWAFKAGAVVPSSTAIGADGTVYVDSGNLYAINADGTQKWAFGTSGIVVASSPALGADGTVYVGSGDDKLYAVNGDGTQKWAFTTGGALESSPIIGADGTVYVGSDDYKLYAINADGTQKWAFTTGGKVESSPSLGAGGTVYVGSEDNKLYAINADGTQKWAFVTGGWVDSSPVIGTDGTVYVGSDDDKLYAINSNGTQKWAFTTGSSVRSSPAIGTDGTVYVDSPDGKLYAVNADGTQKWASATGGNIGVLGIVMSSPAIGADGTIYVGPGGGGSSIYAINADGTQKWVFGTGNEVLSSPAIGADGTVYVGSQDGNLYAIGPGTTTPLTITPATATVAPNATQQFVATPATGVTWTATGGTITNTGFYTAGGNTATFTVTATSTNGTASATVTIAAATPPAAPTLLAPANNATGVDIPVPFSWQQPSGTLTREVQVSDLQDMSDLLVDDTGTTANLSASALVGDNAYYWRVRVTTAGGTSPWSTEWTFTTATIMQGAAPVQLLPANGATGQPQLPYFSWDTVTGASSYHLEIATTPDFAVLTRNHPKITNYWQVQAQLDTGTLFYWRVCANFPDGSVSPWSTTWTFTTLGTPGAVTLLSPPTGTTNVSPTAGVTLTWQAASDATAYTVQYTTNIKGVWTSANVTTGASLALTTLTAASTYTWEVRATNALGNGPWSAQWTFVTAGPPAAPTLTAPANGATGVDFTAVTLTWQASAAATGYTVEYGTDETFAAPVTVAETTQAIQDLRLQPGTTYYWRVNASDVNGTGNWSTIWSFTTIATPGSQPDLLVSLTPGGPWNGSDLYTPDVQAISMTVAPGGTITYWLAVRNNGVYSDTFTVQFSAAAAGWSVSAFDNSGADITADAEGAGWSVTLEPEAMALFTVKVSALNTADTATPDVTTVTATSATTATLTDSIPLTTQANAVGGPPSSAATPATGARADLMILRPDGTGWIGQHIYGSVEDQRRIIYTCANVPATYVIRLANDGIASGTFTLAGPAAPAGWTVTYYDATGADITTAITGTGVQVTLAVGATSDYTLRVIPSTAAGSYTSLPVDVTATLAAPTAVGAGDIVEAVTQCMPASADPTGISPVSIGTPFPVSPF